MKTILCLALLCLGLRCQAQAPFYYSAVGLPDRYTNGVVVGNFVAYASDTNGSDFSWIDVPDLQFTGLAQATNLWGYESMFAGRWFFRYPTNQFTGSVIDPTGLYVESPDFTTDLSYIQIHVINAKTNYPLTLSFCVDLASGYWAEVETHANPATNEVFSIYNLPQSIPRGRGPPLIIPRYSDRVPICFYRASQNIPEVDQTQPIQQFLSFTSFSCGLSIPLIIYHGLRRSK